MEVHFLNKNSVNFFLIHSVVIRYTDESWDPQSVTDGQTSQSLYTLPLFRAGGTKNIKLVNYKKATMKGIYTN